MRVLSTAGDTVITVLNDRADQTFTLPARGTVTNVVIDPNNWILKTLETTAPTLITATAEPALLGLKVYPNPTAETLTVDFTLTASGPVGLSLTNLLGQPVRQMNEASVPPGTYNRTLNLRGLSAGRYLVTVETPAGSQSRTVLIP